MGRGTKLRRKLRGMCVESHCVVLMRLMIHVLLPSFPPLQTSSHAFSYIFSHIQAHFKETVANILSSFGIMLTLVIHAILLVSDYAFAILVFMGALYHLLRSRLNSLDNYGTLFQILPFTKQINHQVRTRQQQQQHAHSLTQSINHLQPQSTLPLDIDRFLW